VDEDDSGDIDFPRNSDGGVDQQRAREGPYDHVKRSVYIKEEFLQRLRGE